MLVATNDHAHWPERVEMLLQLIESEAGSRLANGTPGAWGDISRRCRAAGEAMRAETACDTRWHIYWLELSLWGEVFQRFLLPERQDQLLTTLEAEAMRATPEDPQAWDALLSRVLTRLTDTAADVHPNTFIRIEVRFHRALRTFRADPSASSLRACLTIASELLRVVERQTSHRPCGIGSGPTVHQHQRGPVPDHVDVQGRVPDRHPRTRADPLTDVSRHRRQPLSDIAGARSIVPMPSASSSSRIAAASTSRSGNASRSATTPNVSAPA